MRHFTYILLLGICYCQVICASEQLRFDHYTTKVGLCSDFILGITQDQNGFIWIGTKEGLSRYDGQQFKNYTQSSSGLFRNEVRGLTTLTNNHNQLYIGGSYGMLQYYDPETGTFKDGRFPDMMGKYVKSILGFSSLRDKRSVLLTTSGVFVYNREIQSFCKFPFLSDSTMHWMVQSFHEDAHDRYWIGSFDGLHILNKEGNEIEHFSFDNSNKPITTIFEKDSTEIWVTSNVGDAWSLSVSKDRIIRKGKLNFPFKNISVILRDTQKNLWFGTWGDGLWRMDTLEHFVEIKTFGNDDDLQKIHAIYEDSEHTIWVGTQINGIFCHREKINRVLHSSEIGYPKMDASCFWESPKGKIYVGSDGSGVSIIDLEGRHIQSQVSSFSILGGSVLSFCQYTDQIALVSSWSKGIAFVSADGRVTPISYDSIEQPIVSSKSVLRTMNGSIWVATQGDGIYIKDSQRWRKKELIRPDGLPDNWIEKIVESPDNTLWAISSNGVWHCTDSSEHFYQVLSLDEEPISFTDGICDTNGHFYTASHQGIFEWDESTLQLQRLNFLPEKNYSSIYIDHDETLWCCYSYESAETNKQQSGTSAAILQVDPVHQNYRTLSLSKEKYGEIRFQPRAIFENSLGKLFFGCSNGFLLFEPHTKSVKSAIDYLAWVTASTKDSTYTLSNQPSIELPADNNGLKLTFDLLSKEGIESIICQYRVRENGNEDWTNLLGQREIILNPISPGTYTIELQVFNEGDKKHAQSISVRVTVKPSWKRYKIGGGIALLILTCIIAIRWVIRRKRKSTSPSIETTPINDRSTNETELDMQSGETIHPFLQQILDVIEQHYTDPNFSVEEIAHLLLMSKSTLLRKLKTITDQTPIEILGDYRLKKAEALLQKPGMTVKEVAFLTGFSSPYYLSKKYKEHFGYSPSQKKDSESSQIS